MYWRVYWCTGGYTGVLEGVLIREEIKTLNFMDLTFRSLSNDNIYIDMQTGINLEVLR